MWIYEKKLQYPVKIKTKDIQMAKYLSAQYGGPDEELSAAVRYLNQRYTMPSGSTKGLLTDIGTEELAHVEIIATMIYQLLKDDTIDELKEAGLDHWQSPNTGANNESGFTALPGGYRVSNGYFYGLGYDGGWWSATDGGADEAWYRSLGESKSDVGRFGNYKSFGFSVRCVRNN